ncbi:hypothetical protein GCM10023175_32530 [Pseudonocardia xishanensis]|uniref:PRC-barrel domain-containing protein n=1 Tax=Pseudonocardia xishanensis TaxID=630995 RepID=A0ABP8RUN3_9PSEU
MTFNISDPSTLYGKTVVGRDGDKLGKIDGVFLGNRSERPEWAAVKSGLFGNHVSLVPLATADIAGEDLRVPFDKDALSTADPLRGATARRHRDHRGGPRSAAQIRRDRERHADRPCVARGGAHRA